MLFPEATSDDLKQQWDALSDLREAATNDWLPEWDEPYQALAAARGVARDPVLYFVQRLRD